MSIRSFIKVGLVVIASGCGAKEMRRRARDAYCQELEGSPVHVDNLLDNAALSLRGLRASLNVARAEVEGGAIEKSPVMISEQFWQVGGLCEIASASWKEAATQASATNRAWAEVRQVTGVSTIDPPEAELSARDMLRVCNPDQVVETPQELVASLRTAVLRCEAAQRELKTQQLRWTQARDKAIAGCEASGWHRRYEPGHWQNAKPIPAEDGGSR